MGTSLADTGQCNPETDGQGTLLPSHEQAQHLNATTLYVMIGDYCKAYLPTESHRGCLRGPEPQ